MYTIPQNLKNETEKLIKVEFFKNYFTLIHEFTNNILYNFNSFKFIENELNYEKKLKERFIKTLLNIIPKIDKLFENSKYRKDNFYVSKRDVYRERVLYFGELNYYRNYYCDKDKKNGFFFIDDLFGLKKYKTYDDLIKGLLINQSADTNVNQACNNLLNYKSSILDCLSSDVNHLKIPRQTVYGWINKWQIPNVNFQVLPTNGTLYVMADEKYIHAQMKKELKKKIKIGLKKYTQKQIDEFKEQLKKKHYIMSKCFIVFSGTKNDHGRTILLNRHIFVTSTSTPWKEFMDEVSKIYDFQNIKTINLLSDAGSWILAGKDELKLYVHNNIVVNTCEFHVKQKVNRMIRDDVFNQLMYLDIYEYEDKKDFKKLVDDVILKRPNRKDKIIEYRDYILKHWKTILNMKYCDIKSSMESHISHYVANHFGSRPKAYSPNNIQQYLKIETLKNNGFNILDLYLKSFISSDYTYNEKELDFSIFDPSSSNLPVCTSSNPVSKLLHSIAW